MNDVWAFLSKYFCFCFKTKKKRSKCTKECCGPTVDERYDAWDTFLLTHQVASKDTGMEDADKDSPYKRMFFCLEDDI